jgi:FkbM family methyltransferase
MLQDAVASTPVRSPTPLESCFSGFLRMLPIKHGAHRILDHVKPRPWAKGSHLVDVPYRGHVVQMDVSDLVGWHFLMLRNFDPEVTEVLERFSTGDDKDVFWDIGANKGACSYEIATALPATKIVAIEPQREMQALLRKNLEAVARGRHEIFAMGIGETPGAVEIFIPEGNRGAASMVSSHRRPQGLVETVEVATAESIRQQSRYGWPTIVKIDVEGFEPSVIRSLEPAFAAGGVRCCVFECHPGEADGWQSIRDCTERHGYRLHAIRKSAFATHLVPATSLLAGSTDYAIVRCDLC